MVRGFLAEAVRRKLFRFLTLYVVAAWVALQVADLAFQGMGVPDEAIRYVWYGAFLLVPLVLLIGWRYDLTTHGVVRTPPSDAPGAKIALAPADRLLLSGSGIVTVAVIAFLGMRVADMRVPDAFGPKPVISANSIAVLPLDNLTGDPDQAYFVAGMHDALISYLSKIDALKVISRTSANAYRDAAKTLPQIARELRVARLVEGTVYRDGSDIRISVQLIDGKTDEHLWAESYERDVANILSLQADMARDIAGQFENLLRPDSPSPLQGREVDPETFELYLKGMYHLYQFTPEGIERGLALLHQAVDRDPGDPLAYAGLALGYNEIGHASGPRSAFPKAKAAARTALKLDPASAEAYAALAEATLYFDWDWEQSRKYFERALELNPHLSQALGHYAFLLILIDSPETAFDHAERARQASPLAPVWPSFACWLYMVEDRFDEAIAACEDALDLVPDFPLGLYCLGQVYTAMGRIEDAIAAHERIPQNDPMRNKALGPTLAMAGRRDEAVALAEAMLADPDPKDLLHAAFVYTALGENDEAVRRLEIAYDARVDWFPWIASHNGYGGVLEGMRDDPRFVDLIARLDLPD
jgi:TolB-like protein/Tfp pilus assembly protein PilF